jgi:hypothetical protein
MNLRFPKALVLTFMASFSLNAQAQPELPKSLQRYQVGYSYVMANARLKYSYAYPDYYGRMFDTAVDIRMPSKGGFGVTMGTYIPLAQMGKTSNLNLGIDGVFNIAIWDMEQFYSSAGEDLGPYYSADYVITAGTIQYGLATTLDFKAGCDAMLDKKFPYCFTFGAGAFPTFALTTFYGLPGFSKIRVRPILKAEMGFRLGICLKARILYLPGTFRYMGYDDETAGYSESFALESKGTLTASLVIMPFSWAWKKGERWF